MYLVFYTLIGDGSDVREVHVRAVTAEGMQHARERVERWFGQGYLHVVKVEHVG